MALRNRPSPKDAAIRQVPEPTKSSFADAKNAIRTAINATANITNIGKPTKKLPRGLGVAGEAVSVIRFTPSTLRVSLGPKIFTGMLTASKFNHDFVDLWIMSRFFKRSRLTRNIECEFFRPNVLKTIRE